MYNPGQHSLYAIPTHQSRVAESHLGKYQRFLSSVHSAEPEPFAGCKTASAGRYPLPLLPALELVTPGLSELFLTRSKRPALGPPLAQAAGGEGHASHTALAPSSLQHFVPPSRHGKAAFQRKGWMLMPSGFDQSPCLVIQSKGNSWTYSCWGKALSSLLQAQPTPAWLGERSF